MTISTKIPGMQRARYSIVVICCGLKRSMYGVCTITHFRKKRITILDSSSGFEV